MPVNVRFMQKDDVPAVLECETSCHQFADPDFDVPQLRPWAWSEEDVIMAVRQRKSKDSHDSRAFVAEVDKKVAGALIYELRPEGYHILLFTTHDTADDEVSISLLTKVMALAERSPKRKQISIDVMDGNYRTLKLFMGHGFKTQAGRDVWNCTFSAPQLSEKV
jgi:hypothetical protein